jgi:YaiO family outer membrane protein
VLLCLFGLVPAMANAQSLDATSPPQPARALDTDAHHELAFEYLRAGDFATAEREFSALLEVDANNVDWLLGRGQSLIATGRAAEAVPLLERARGRAPDYEDVWRAELNAREASGDVAGAAALLEQAARQFPDSDWPAVRQQALRERELLQRGTRVSLTSSYEHLSDDKGDWRSLALALDHPLRAELHLLLGLRAEERFEERDEQLAAGLVQRFGASWSAAVNASVAPDASVLPQDALEIEIGRPVSAHASVALRARHAHYETVDVNMLAASVEIGSGNYRAGYSLVASRPSDLDVSWGHLLRLSRDYGVGSHANLSLAYGVEAETVAPGQVLVTLNKSLAVHGLHWRSAAWGLGWEISYHEQGDLYHRLRFACGLEHRF